MPNYCHKCKNLLVGRLQIESKNNNSEGTNLGLNCYFVNGHNISWVYFYCKKCYDQHNQNKKEQIYSSLNSKIQLLQEKVKDQFQEIQNIQQYKDSLENQFNKLQSHPHLSNLLSDLNGNIFQNIKSNETKLDEQFFNKEKLIQEIFQQKNDLKLILQQLNDNSIKDGNKIPEIYLQINEFIIKVSNQLSILSNNQIEQCDTQCDSRDTKSQYQDSKSYEISLFDNNQSSQNDINQLSPSRNNQSSFICQNQSSSNSTSQSSSNIMNENAINYSRLTNINCKQQNSLNYKYQPSLIYMNQPTLNCSFESSKKDSNKGQIENDNLPQLDEYQKEIDQVTKSMLTSIQNIQNLEYKLINKLWFCSNSYQNFKQDQLEKQNKNMLDQENLLLHLDLNDELDTQFDKQCSKLNSQLQMTYLLSLQVDEIYKQAKLMSKMFQFDNQMLDMIKSKVNQEYSNHTFNIDELYQETKQTSQFFNKESLNIQYKQSNVQKKESSFISQNINEIYNEDKQTSKMFSFEHKMMEYTQKIKYEKIQAVKVES